MNVDFIQVLRFLLYFIIYSFLGWVIESIFKSVCQKKIVNSGFLHSPFCPIYGFGAIIMLLFLSPFKNNIVLLFIMAFIVMSIWEYIVGWYLEKKFNTKYWDYTGNFLNIKGRVCFVNSTFWGILGVLFMVWVHPFINMCIQVLNKETLYFLDIILCIAIGTDTVITTIKIKSFDSTLNSIKELGETIKIKLNELKEIKSSSNNDSLEKVKTTEKLIEDLKEKQELLKFKLYRQVIRLKKAFPTIKSESISQFLNQKIDIKELKNKIKNRINNK